MPPRVAKLPTAVLFGGTAGDPRKLDAAFRASLVGEGPLSVDPAHWILTVLPSLSPSAVTMRLLVYVFLPAFIFADDLDLEVGAILLYPAPLCCSRLLHRLLKEGMSAEPLLDVRALRARVLDHSAMLPLAFRLLARANVVVVKPPPSSVLASMFPLMFRGTDGHNGVLAAFLATLPGYFIGVTRGLMPAALAAIVPPSASPSDPPSLLALTCVSHIRDTQPAPPFDSFLAFGDLIPELMRMRMPSAEARFIPLFDRDWRSAYPTLSRVFRGVTSATELRQHLRTLAVALRIPFDSFSESTIRGLCISVSHLLSELEVELPSTTAPTPDEVIATLVRLVRRTGPDSSSAGSSAADSSRSAVHADEAGYSKLLAIPSFADLYSKIVALNTSAFHASLAISLALSHPHPAALIVMLTTKTLPQPGWSSVVGAMRQKTAWPNVFDKALAVDSDGNVAHDWGVMLPVDAKGTSTIVQHLVMGKLHLITDWWSALSKWIGLYVGTHVLLLPEYAPTPDPQDFWLSASRMRLVSPAMYAIFSCIAHGQSRSVPGSFREWYELHIARVTRIMHLPQSTPAYAATVSDCRSAVAMLFKEHDEAFATMVVRPFHEAVRPVFLDQQRACYVSFQSLDSELSLLQAQIALAVKGRASYQAPHLQNMVPPALPLPPGPAVAAPAPSPSFQRLAASSSSAPRAASSQLQHASSAFPTDVYDGWGPKAIRHGVWLNDEGLVFGNTQCHASKQVTFAPGTCAAAAAANGNARARSQWCLTPSACLAFGYAAHERPAGTTDADFTFTEIDKAVDRSTWRVVTPVVANLPRNPPPPPWNTFFGPGSKQSDKQSPTDANKARPRDKRKPQNPGGGKDRNTKKPSFSGQLPQQRKSNPGTPAAVAAVLEVPAFRAAGSNAPRPPKDAVPRPSVPQDPTVLSVSKNRRAPTSVRVTRQACPTPLERCKAPARQCLALHTTYTLRPSCPPLSYCPPSPTSGHASRSSSPALLHTRTDVDTTADVLQLRPKPSPTPLPRSASSSPNGARAPGTPRPPTPPPNVLANNALRALLTVAAASPAVAQPTDISGAPVTAGGRHSPAPREHYPPLAPSFSWPYVEHFSFFDHSGAIRESWGQPAISVADRPTDRLPSEECHHFVMDVYVFLSMYPYPIGTQVNSVVCTHVTFAQHSRWRDFVLSGALWSTAEQFLFMLHVGDRAACEQPPGALDHIVGRPTFATSSFEHGDAVCPRATAAKSYHWFLRNLPVVPPSHPVAPEYRRARASHSNPEVQMLLRSAFSDAFAAAHTRAWAQPLPPPPHASRPASQVDPAYADRRRALECNYWAFASQFAPRVSADLLAAADRPTLLVAVPIGWTGLSVAALVPSDGGAFASPLIAGEPLLQQLQLFTACLPCNEQPQEMNIMRDQRADIVFALPCVFRITTAGPAHSSHPSAAFARWTSLTDLAPASYVHTAVALERCRSFLQPGPFLSARVGVHQGPQPVTPNRAAASFRRRAATMASVASWDKFLKDEAQRKHDLTTAFTERNADGLLSPFISCIVTAADLAHELVPPPQGFEAPAVDVVLLAPYPAPPMPLHTDYLARLPAQQAPDGWPPSFAYDEIYKGWARRCLANALNSTAEHDFECFRKGWSERPRHPFIALGPGAFHSFPFADGLGSITLNQFIFESCPDHRLRLMDFSQPTFDHKDLTGVMGVMGFTTDKELLAFLIHGVRWKVDAPRQIRIGHNVFSLKERVQGVGEAIAKLVHKGLYRAFRVRDERSPLTDASPCPLATSPQYSMGMGGADKTDSPDEKRPTGDPATPHEPVRARNAPHGDPDGDWVINFNDLTGPRGSSTFPDGSPTPFPDRETKPRPREVYAANEYIRSLAWVNGTYPSCSRDDVRWMFFQFYLEPCDYWLSVSYLVIAVCLYCDGFHVLCNCPRRETSAYSLHLFCIMPRVMNMGTRPSSKIAVRFSKQINVEWRARMADFVQAEWLARQSPALRDVLARREASLGYEQAHPFWCTEYTDDFWDVTPETSLTAHGAFVRRDIARQMNLWMSSKACAGTCCDYTGTRCSLTGGFGTVVPAKRARCIADCLAALANLLTKGELHAHNSYLVHLVDVLDLDPQLLKGNWLPASVSVPDFVVIDISGPRFARMRANYAAIIDAVSTRPAASFMSGFRDAPSPTAPVPSSTVARRPAPVLSVRMASDCMANAVACAIFGHALEYEWYIDLASLDARWLRRHVNVGEAVGAAVNVAVFGLAFHMFELIQEGDNTTEGAMVLGRARTPEQQFISNRMRATNGFRLCEDTLWFEHSAGLGQGFSDAGSRGYETVLANLAAAFGRRRTKLDVLKRSDVRSLLADVLDNTADYVGPKRRRPAPLPAAVPPPPHASDARATLPEERGDGVCPSALCNSASLLPPAALSPTPPRQRAPPRPAISPVRKLSALPPAEPTPPRHGDALSRPLLLPTQLSPTPPPRRRRTESPSACATSAPPAASARSTTPLAPSPVPLRARHPLPARSPQPLTADAARARAVLEVGARLCDPANPYAMGPAASLPGAAGPRLIVDAERCARAGTPAGTRSSDNWGFNWAARFCAAYDLPVMRPRAHDRHHIVEADEARILALMVFWVAQRMRPSPRRLKAGYGRAQPPSAVQAAYGYRRTLRDCGRHVASMLLVAQVLKGLVVEYLAEWGQNALTPRHHVPYSIDVLRALERVLRAGDEPSLSAPCAAALHACVTFNLARGPRLDEWCQMHDNDTFYRRANFCWAHGRRLLGSTPQALAAGLLRDGALLRCQNVPSKTDRSGQKWTGKFMWYRLDSSDPLNFPASWLRYESLHPCPEPDRPQWAAFSPTGASAAFRPAAARAALRSLLVRVGGPQLADVHAWHDFRATVASALKLAEHSDATVQALVGWATADSVHLYGQMTPDAMATAASATTRVDASRNASIAIPHVSPDTVAAEALLCADFLAPAPAAAASSAAPGPKPPAARRATAPAAHAARRPRPRANAQVARAAESPLARTSAKRARALSVAPQGPTPKRLLSQAPSPTPATPAALAPPLRAAGRPRQAAARPPSPAPCAGVTPTRFPPTLEGYSTYFERPSSRPSPRLRAR